ncbi:hypothetical protein EYF80_027900 [Liparis tanakae]|uniref:Uncharacterized protein n=1 Tax=Liparis tanakae TaxID=230148 RepID=A0A4Z2HAG9_9TELE|nr:hypothetical protein EYF80_027900 [Liparis tanakae]
MEVPRSRTGPRSRSTFSERSRARHQEESRLRVDWTSVLLAALLRSLRLSDSDCTVYVGSSCHRLQLTVSQLAWCIVPFVELVNSFNSLSNRYSIVDIEFGLTMFREHPSRREIVMKYPLGSEDCWKCRCQQCKKEKRRDVVKHEEANAKVFLQYQRSLGKVPWDNTKRLIVKQIRVITQHHIVPDRGPAVENTGPRLIEARCRCLGSAPRSARGVAAQNPVTLRPGREERRHTEETR